MRIDEFWKEWLSGFDWRKAGRIFLEVIVAIIQAATFRLVIKTLADAFVSIPELRVALVVIFSFMIGMLKYELIRDIFMLLWETEVQSLSMCLLAWAILTAWGNELADCYQKCVQVGIISVEGNKVMAVTCLGVVIVEFAVIAIYHVYYEIRQRRERRIMTTITTQNESEGS